jgi:hypothetical protein
MFEDELLMTPGGIVGGMNKCREFQKFRVLQETANGPKLLYSLQMTLVPTPEILMSFSLQISSISNRYLLLVHFNLATLYIPSETFNKSFNSPSYIDYKLDWLDFQNFFH